MPRCILVLLLFGSLMFYRVQDWHGHSRSLVLCSVTHFCVDFDYCPVGRHIFKVILALRYSIESTVPTIWTRYPGSLAENWPTTLEILQCISLYPCALNPSWVFAAKKLFVLVSSDRRSQSHEVSVVSDNWICWSLFLWLRAFSFLDFSWNPSKQSDEVLFDNGW